MKRTIHSIAVVGLSSCIALLAQTQSSSTQTQSTSQTSNKPTQQTSPTAARSTASAVIMPSRTSIEVRVNETLSSDTTQAGERFTGAVATDVSDANGRVLIPRGAEVNGRVLEAKPSGRLSDAGELELSINTIRYAGRVLNVTVDPFVIKGQSHTKSNTTKIGGGAALGAIIGAIAGGGKGAAVGAGVGAAAGTGAAAATGKKEARVESEAVLKFLTATEARVVPAAQTQVASSRIPDQTTSQTTRDDEQPVLRRRDETSTSTQTTTSAPASNTSGTGTSNTSSTATGSSNTGLGAAQTSTTGMRGFSLRDRRVVTHCLAENANSLPAPVTSSTGAAAGVSRQLVKGAVVPQNIQRSVRSLPLQCDRELPPLPDDMERVVYAGKVMLIDANSRIIDIIELQQ